MSGKDCKCDARGDWERRARNKPPCVMGDDSRVWDPLLLQSAAFFDLEKVAPLVEKWRELMPEVAPFYAVKCNPDERILLELARNGSSFDCASPTELALVKVAISSALVEKKGSGAADEQTVLALMGQHVLFANPCKHPGDLVAAVRDYGVTRTTADSVGELRKIAKYTPHVEVLLRIFARDPSSQCDLSNRFGANRGLWVELLQAAQDLSVKVVGVSFHVGSGASSAEAYSHAVADSFELMRQGRSFGHNMTVLDVGGGFTTASLPRLAPPLRIALKEGQQQRRAELDLEMIEAVDVPDVVFLAEPGRYFAESLVCVVVPIIGVREQPQPLSGPFDEEDEETVASNVSVPQDGLSGTESRSGSPDDEEARCFSTTTTAASITHDTLTKNCQLLDKKMLYTVYESVYGTFNSIIYDHAHPVARPLEVEHLYVGAHSVSAPCLPGMGRPYGPASVFGATCDGLDVLASDCSLPFDMEVGDFLMWLDMGAYTTAAGSSFNGLQFPSIARIYNGRPTEGALTSTGLGPHFHVDGAHPWPPRRTPD